MTGLIYVAIVALWAVVLVPMWLRRHDLANEARNVDRFNDAMRTLSRSRTRRARGYGEREIVQPRRDRRREVVVTGAAARAANRSGGRSGGRSADRVQPVHSRPDESSRAGQDRRDERSARPERSLRDERAQRDARARAAGRRRRVLLLLVAVLVFVVLAVVLGRLPAWTLAAAAGAFLLFALVAQAQVRAQRRQDQQRRDQQRRTDRRTERSWDEADAGRSDRRQRPAPRRTAASSAGRARGRGADPRAADPWAADPWAEDGWTEDAWAEDARAGRDWPIDVPRPGRRHVTPAPAPAFAWDPEPEYATTPGQSGPGRGGDQSWEPVPQTLPTYVTAPRASRVPRLIDLTHPGQWDSSAMLEQAEEIRQASRAERLRAEQEAALRGDDDEQVIDLADPGRSRRRRAVND